MSGLEATHCCRLSWVRAQMKHIARFVGLPGRVWEGALSVLRAEAPAPAPPTPLPGAGCRGPSSLSGPGAPSSPGAPDLSPELPLAVLRGPAPPPPPPMPGWGGRRCGVQAGGATFQGGQVHDAHLATPLPTLRDGALKRGPGVSAEHAVTLSDTPASQLHGLPASPVHGAL